MGVLPTTLPPEKVDGEPGDPPNLGVAGGSPSTFSTDSWFRDSIADPQIFELEISK